MVILEHEDVRAVIVQNISTALERLLGIPDSATRQDAKSSSSLAKSTQQLIEFTVPDIARVILTFEEYKGTSNAMAQVSEESRGCCVLENNINSLPSFVEVLLLPAILE